MIIFKDIVTEDELLTDAFKIEEVNDGIFYRVEGKTTTETTTVDESAIGGNASAEGGDDAAANESSVSGIDVILRGRLVETGFKTKKDYQKYLKEYMKKVIDHLTKTNPGRVDDFKAKVSVAVKEQLDKFKDLQFFMGESCDPDSMHVLCYYGDDGVTPYFLFFKDGLIEEKV